MVPLSAGKRGVFLAPVRLFFSFQESPLADNNLPPVSGAFGEPDGSGNATMLIDIEHELRRSYLGYAVSTLISRALPDVRDGFKPVQRRILYAMRDLGIGPGSARVKSARVVGQTMGKLSSAWRRRHLRNPRPHGAGFQPPLSAH